MANKSPLHDSTRVVHKQVDVATCNVTELFPYFAAKYNNHICTLTNIKERPNATDKWLSKEEMAACIQSTIGTPSHNRTLLNAAIHIFYLPTDMDRPILIRDESNHHLFLPISKQFLKGVSAKAHLHLNNPLEFNQLYIQFWDDILALILRLRAHRAYIMHKYHHSAIALPATAEPKQKSRSALRRSLTAAKHTIPGL